MIVLLFLLERKENIENTPIPSMHTLILGFSGLFGVGIGHTQERPMYGNDAIAMLDILLAVSLPYALATSSSSDASKSRMLGWLDDHDGLEWPRPTTS